MVPEFALVLAHTAIQDSVQVPVHAPAQVFVHAPRQESVQVLEQACVQEPPHSVQLPTHDPLQL